MDDRKAAQSMDFEQFHALRNRRRNKTNAEGATAASVADEEKSDATAAPAQPEERVKLSDTVGDFVEMHEVQLVVILLIVADVVAVVLELFIDLGALGNSAAVTQLSSLLDAFTGFTIFFFLIELGLNFFAFGEAALLHVGYALDSAVVLASLYWEVNMQSKTLRLLGCARVWRAVRLVNAMVGVTQAEREKVEAQLGQTRVALAEMEVEKERAEQALRREVEAKRAVEKQVQGYKDMNETLHEALSIAANNAAEHQLLDGDGEAFLKDLEGDDAQGASAGGGNKGGAKAQAAAAQKFVVSADGSYKKQGQE